MSTHVHRHVYTGVSAYYQQDAQLAASVEQSLVTAVAEESSRREQAAAVAHAERFLGTALGSPLSSVDANVLEFALCMAREAGVAAALLEHAELTLRARRGLSAALGAMLEQLSLDPLPLAKVDIGVMFVDVHVDRCGHMGGDMRF